MANTKPNQPKAPPASELTAKIGRPAQQALAEVGYTRLEQLTQVTEAELLKLHGVGPKAIRLLREDLAAQGLSFADHTRG